VLRKLFHGLPAELVDWFRACKALKGTDIVVMTGTGMLTDYSTTCFGYPYDVLKWAIAARVSGAKVRFVGIGVGPIYERLSRAFIKCALRIADYRSFRDQHSKAKLERLGFDTANDSVFPDLAFSLPASVLPAVRRRRHGRRVIGVGVMNYVDAHSTTPFSAAKDYDCYLTKMSTFVSTLVEKGYGVRILQGDMKYDSPVRQDLRERLEGAGVSYSLCGIIDEDVTGVEDLLKQLATVDVVVSPRFHNLILGLMLGIPVVSLSYDPKHDALLEAFDLGKYCHDIGNFDVNLLTAQLLELDAMSDSITPLLRVRTSEYRERLAQQYQLILNDLCQPAASAV
jgi:polysaccharide pyruvyl transferase WcaK-like protein